MLAIPLALLALSLPDEPVRGIYGGAPTDVLDGSRPLSDYGVNAIWFGSDGLNAESIATLKKQGARVFAEFNTLHAAEYLEEHPDAAPVGPDGKSAPPPDGWQGVCPTHPGYRAARMAAFRRALSEFEIDGVWLDYHHAHASWEQAEPNLPDTCFCVRCLAMFDERTGLRLSSLPPRIAAHEILEHLRDRWVAFRCAILTDWVREFDAIRDEARPTALLGVFHCPWSDTDRDNALRNKLFIDLKAWKPHVDVYSPMPYHARFGHADDVEWIARQTTWLGQFLDLKGTPDEATRIWPIVQLSDWGESVVPADVPRILKLGAQRPATGVMVFNWGSLHAERAKIDAMTRTYREMAATTQPTDQGPRTTDIAPIPDALRASLSLDPDFYRKHIVVYGFPIVSSERVSDFALREAADILRRMMAGNPGLLTEMARNQVRLVIMAHDEYTTDVPEQRGMKPKVYWDRRARGLGGSPDDPLVSCAEENLLHYPNDPYGTESITIHEFAHSIHLNGLRTADPTFNGRLEAAFEAAKAAGLWKNTYALTDPSEYFAEGVQSWFDTNRQNDAQHNHVDIEELKEYDPALAALCAEVFGENDWRYRRIPDRDPAERAHLEGYDPGAAPTFRWREEPVPDRPRVQIETDLGEIELELDAARAPTTVKNFLDHAHRGLYADGAFFRTVHAENQPDSPVKIAVIQARANPEREKEFNAPIRLERTRDTGLKHFDGTVSMARDGPDTAQADIFLCVGDQPELDFGGRRNPDGQGFAAFGRVVRGMDVVRSIHAAPADGQALTPPIRIQRVIRLN
jgi:cyclophilin family peptidyl-prolyl cis-trans isomerase